MPLQIPVLYQLASCKKKRKEKKKPFQWRKKKIDGKEEEEQKRKKLLLFARTYHKTEAPPTHQRIKITCGKHTCNGKHYSWGHLHPLELAQPYTWIDNPCTHCMCILEQLSQSTFSLHTWTVSPCLHPNEACEKIVLATLALISLHTLWVKLIHGFHAFFLCYSLFLVGCCPDNILDTPF